MSRMDTVRILMVNIVSDVKGMWERQILMIRILMTVFWIITELEIQSRGICYIRSCFGPG